MCVTAALTVGPKPGTLMKKDNRNYQIKSSGRKKERPLVEPEDKECLVTWTKVGDLKAWTLWDSGSTTSGITPSYAELANIIIDTLETPHILQLGTVGSHSIIKLGADVAISIGGRSHLSYVDVANFNHYDMIIGMPFMRKNKILLDFQDN